MSCTTVCFHTTAHILCTQFSFKFHLLNLLTMSCMTGCFHTTAALPIHSVHSSVSNLTDHLLNFLTMSCTTVCFHTTAHILCTQFSFKFHLLNLLTMSCMTGCIPLRHCAYTLYTVQFQI